MPDGLYETDALAWSQLQSSLLQCLAAGERPNEPIDWVHVVEEIRDVGLSELRACQSLLVQAMTHLLKLHRHPESDAVAHWRGETAAFLAGVRRSFTPSMRQRIDLAALYADAAYDVANRLPEGVATPVACPYTLDDLLHDRPDLSGLVARLASP